MSLKDGEVALPVVARPEFGHLPDDVMLQILDLLPPGDIATFATVNQSTCRVARDPAIWASAARRHLAVAPTHGGPRTAAAVRDLARSLLCHWCVTTGLFVAGVPVHRRSGFVHVSSRGGVEVTLGSSPDSAAEACYVFGGRHSHRAVPTSVPSLALNFALNPAGPFPVSGLQVRIVLAAEPPLPPAPSSPLQQQGLSPPPVSSLAPPAPETRLLIRMNDTVVSNVVCKPTTSFSVINLFVRPETLNTKPALNCLSVEYDRDSTTGLWLRDIALGPTIIPLPQLADDALEFPLATASLPPIDPLTAFDHVVCPSSPPPLALSPPSSSRFSIPSSPSSSSSLSSSTSTSSSPRRNTRRAGEGRGRGRPTSSPRTARASPPPAALLDSSPSPQQDRHAKQHKGNKRSKNMYHKQNHHRSPRSPHSGNRNRARR